MSTTPQNRPQAGALLELLGRPIAFQQAYARLPGQNALSALLLSQMCYWSTRTQDGTGWFYKTQEEWFREIAMTRTELQTARKRLRDAGYITEKRKGNPAKIYFHVNALAIEAGLWDIVCGENSNEITSLQESCNQEKQEENSIESPVCRNPVNKSAGILQTSLQESCNLSTENTTENTTERKTLLSDAAASNGKRKLWGTDFDYDAAHRMFDLLYADVENPKQPNWDRWANDFRLMREKDSRTEAQIAYMIRWIANDDFWASNCLSPEKMRKHFDKFAVKIKAQKEKLKGNNNGNGNQSDRQRVKATFANPCDQSWADGLIVPE